MVGRLLGVVRRAGSRPAAIVVFALLAAAGAAAHELVATRDVDAQIASVSLGGTAHALVVLPRGYDDSQIRYPVVYFLHGLPASASSYLANAWLAQALDHVGPAILVQPQGARSGESDPEYLNWGAGDDWETFVSEELPHYIDKHFRTIPTRRGRAIVGLSAGGYGATILGIHHLASFSVIESWSGYFHATDPSGTRPLARGPLTNAHRLIASLKAGESTRPTFLGFYVGSGDTRFRDENVQFNRELTAARIPHVFRIYAGGHTDALWRTHAAAWLRLALARLARPQP